MLKKAALIITFIILMILGLCNTYHLYEYYITWKFEYAGLQSHYLKTSDTALHYWMGGNGSPLVLIHGFGADSRFQWHNQVGELSKQHTLIIPDLVYFNSSTSSSGDYSVDFQAATVLALLRNLQVERFSVAGISYGGMVAITISDKILDSIDKMIICGSPIRCRRLHYRKQLLRKFKAQNIEELLMPESPEDIPRLLEITHYNPPRVPGIALQSIHDNMFKNQALEKKKLLEYLDDNDRYLAERDYAVACRVLLVWGRHDELVPLKVGTDLKKYLGGRAKLEIIDKSGHTPNLEQPDKFYKVMSDFLMQ